MTKSCDKYNKKLFLPRFLFSSPATGKNFVSPICKQNGCNCHFFGLTYGHGDFSCIFPIQEADFIQLPHLAALLRDDRSVRETLSNKNDKSVSRACSTIRCTVKHLLHLSAYRSNSICGTVYCIIWLPLFHILFSIITDPRRSSYNEPTNTSWKILSGEKLQTPELSIAHNTAVKTTASFNLPIALLYLREIDCIPAN